MDEFISAKVSAKIHTFDQLAREIDAIDNEINNGV